MKAPIYSDFNERESHTQLLLRNFPAPFFAAVSAAGATKFCGLIIHTLNLNIALNYYPRTC